MAFFQFLVLPELRPTRRSLPSLDLGPDAVDLDLEQLFDGLLDLGLVGVEGHLEADLPVLVLEHACFSR